MKRVRIRDCVYWGWGPFWALVVQILIWWPIVELVVRIESSNSRVGSNLLFYIILFSLPFIGIAVNFCLFLFLRADIAVGLFWLCSFLLTFFVCSFTDAHTCVGDVYVWLCSLRVVSGYFAE